MNHNEKSTICLKKKIVQGFTWKKIPAQAMQKKSCKLKIPHPPITFLMVRP